MDENSRLVLMDQDRIKRSLNRIAHQIREDNRKDRDIELLGINERGYAIASMLKQYLAELTGTEVGCFQLLIEEGEGIKGKPVLKENYVLLVDDVIFSGATLFKALNAISKVKLPEELHTAVLVDRGHRKFPVFAKFVGMDLPTKLDEHVSVELEKGLASQVLLTQSMYQNQT